MPVVSRADCTELNIKEYYTFTKKAGESGFTGEVDYVDVDYNACQGKKNNDLETYFQRLVDEGRLTTEQQDIFSKRVVGNDQCNNAISTLIPSEDYYIDTSKWTFIVGEGFDEEGPILDARMFKAMFEAQDESFRIVRRVCPSCSGTHRDIYYKRLTAMSDDFDLLDTLMNDWSDEGNTFNVDFSLYSSLMDAYYDENRWEFCNFSNIGIGFPNECGPIELVGGNWNSYYRNGGKANHHAFLIPSNSTFDPSTIVNIAPKGYARQSSTYGGRKAARAIDGNTIGIHDWGTVTGNFDLGAWWSLTFDYVEVNFSKIYV